MKAKIILFLVLALALGFGSSCSAKTTEITIVQAQTTTIQESSEAIYLKEMIRISEGVTNLAGVYYEACNDYLNLDINLAQHKEATNDFIGNILLLCDDYEKLDPPDKFIQMHNLVGTSMQHYRNSTGYLTKYIESDDLNEMSICLEKAVYEVGSAAQYFNEANEEINNISNDYILK